MYGCYVVGYKRQAGTVCTAGWPNKVKQDSNQLLEKQKIMQNPFSQGAGLTVGNILQIDMRLWTMTFVVQLLLI